ncbi:hypothetical protein FH972_023582 [Carpinus fangiana]|uniref:AAA+ ATPase domain-containing protein n=1 Tax=Carpinus fangiana TaxID=176857 RepID=A0A5N6KW34_9ROSI|nr:hypothetical protein FH972_023582 [Carpinus fangiana]
MAGMSSLRRVLKFGRSVPQEEVETVGKAIVRSYSWSVEDESESADEYSEADPLDSQWQEFLKHADDPPPEDLSRQQQLLLQSSRRLAKAWQAFAEKLPEGASSVGQRPSFDVLNHTLGNAIQSWKSKHDASRRGKLQKRFTGVIRVFQGHRELLKMVPTGDRYVSLIAGSLTAFAQASVTHAEIAEGISNAFQDAQADLDYWKRLLAANQDNTLMQNYAIELFVIIFEMFADIFTTWSSYGSMRHFFKSFDSDFLKRLVGERQEEMVKLKGRLSEESELANTQGIRRVEASLIDFQQQMAIGSGRIESEMRSIVKDVMREELDNYSKNRKSKKRGPLLLGAPSKQASTATEDAEKYGEGTLILRGPPVRRPTLLEEEETIFTEEQMTTLRQGFDLPLFSRLQKWAQSDDTHQVYIQGPRSARITVGSMIAVCNASDVPVLYYSCAKPSSEDDVEDYQRLQLARLVSNLLEQLEKYVPEAQSSRLNDRTTVAEAIDILEQILHRGPSLIFCILDGLHNMEDRRDSEQQGLIKRLVAALTMNKPVADGRIIKTCFASDGIIDTLEKRECTVGGIPSVKYDTLQYLLGEDTMVYFHVPGFPSAWAAGIITSLNHIDGIRSIYLRVLASDGNFVAGRTLSVEIAKFEGSVEVTKLEECRPAKYVDAKDQGRLREELLRRGKSFTTILASDNKEYQYSGLFHEVVPHKAIEKYDPSVPEVLSSRDYTGRIVVDIKSAYLYCPRRRDTEENLLRNVFDDDFTAATNFEDDEESSDDADSERVGIISTEHISIIQRYPDPFSMVMLEAGELQTIKALRNVGLPDKDDWSVNYAEQKRRGHVVLFHGPPGVGKTFTVECIAEAFKRPLLTFALTDMGAMDQELDTQLSRYFLLAEKWGAIILVEDADVILERRSRANEADFDQNRRLDYFWRSLENFSGLTFLNTNRFGVVDEAYISRVHVFVAFKDLDNDKSARLWKFLLDRVEGSRDDILVTQESRQFVLENQELRLCKWNARQIRNAIDTILALAKDEHDSDPDRLGPIRLNSHHFAAVVHMIMVIKHTSSGMDLDWWVGQAERPSRSTSLNDSSCLPTWRYQLPTVGFVVKPKMNCALVVEQPAHSHQSIIIAVETQEIRGYSSPPAGPFNCVNSLQTPTCSLPSTVVSASSPGSCISLTFLPIRRYTECHECPSILGVRLNWIRRPPIEAGSSPLGTWTFRFDACHE